MSNTRELERVVMLRGRQSGISPWLFVMATALNTMVAALLAVIITLGVVRQEQTGNQQVASPAGYPGSLTVGESAQAITAAPRSPQGGAAAAADLPGSCRPRSFHSCSRWGAGGDNLVRGVPNRLRHMALAAGFGEPARDCRARMVDIGVRDRHRAAADQRLGCRADEG